jgi:L-iditol 2-dehydrogenase/galactitol-1-phosphate 5-dehydrogenase
MPQPRDENDVLLRIAACGICGSDMHRAFENGAYHYPLVLGHEFSAVVEEAPPASSLGNGDRVTVFPLLPCRTCRACSTGDYAQCAHYDYYGSRRDGAFCEYLYVPESNIFPVPDGVDIIHAAMTEPCAVALHGVRRLYLEAGMTALLIGAGPVGTMAAGWLRISGCRDIYIADIDHRKLQIAEGLGFNTIDCGSMELTDIVDTISAFKGFDVVVEAAGSPSTYRAAVYSTARAGQTLFLGNMRGTLSIEAELLSQVLRRELTIYGSWNSKPVPRGSDDWTTVLSYLDRGIETAPLISHTPLLQDCPDIMQAMHSGSDFFNKVIVRIIS